jgi:hypothetical protein
MNLKEILGLSVSKIPIPPIRRFLNASDDKFEYQDDIERHQDIWRGTSDILRYNRYFIM